MPNQKKPNMVPKKPNIAPKKTNIIPWVIIVAILVIIIIILAGLLVYFVTEDDNKNTNQTANLNSTNINATANTNVSINKNENENINAGINKNTNTSFSEPIIIQENLSTATSFDKPMEEGRILYISEGDLWMSTFGFNEAQIKLIDGDDLVDAQYSPDYNKIAYTKKRTFSQEVDYGDSKETQEFITKELYVANGIGQNSFLVNDSINEWGWIPNTDLLWYETASLQNVFSWEIWADGDFYTVDSDGGQAELIIDSELWESLGLKWDPTGEKLLFVRSAYPDLGLYVFNRTSKETKKVFNVPHIGGDRGGPPPIPSLFWSTDGSKIYTGFTPLYLSEEQKTEGWEDTFTEGELSIWEINTETGESKTLYTALACPTNEEMYPQIVFADDFSKAAFFKVSAGSILDQKNSATPYCDDNTKVDYVLYDFDNQTESKLVKGLSSVGYVSFAENIENFNSNGKIYLFNKDKQQSDVSLFIINLADNSVQQLILENGIQIKLAISLSDPSITPENYHFFFYYKNSVYLVAPKESGYHTVYEMLDNASNVYYYYIDSPEDYL